MDETNIQRQSDAYEQLGALYSDQGKMKEAEEIYILASMDRIRKD
jgi:hypothetical protein